MFALTGSDRFRLIGCSVTVENVPGRPTTVVELSAGRSRVSNMDAMDDNPLNLDKDFEIRIADSVVRSRCGLIVSTLSYPGRIEIDNCALALDGPLFEQFGDHNMPRENQRIELRMEHTTCILNGGLVRMDSGDDPRNLLPLDISARDNVFASGDADPLLEMSGNTDVEDFLSLLQWSGSHNYFSKVETFWLITSTDSLRGTRRFEFDDWKNFWGPKLTSRADNVELQWNDNPLEIDLLSLQLHELTLDENTRANPAIGGAADGTNAGFDPSKLSFGLPIDAPGDGESR